jgi:uncharacterized protein (DUF427 family)
MKFLFALCLIALTIQAQEVVFRGVPNVRVFTSVEQEQREKLEGADAQKNECVVVRKGRKYYWSSRNDAELERVDAPQFTYFMHKGGAGYIKILTGDRREMNAPADYIENINQGFDVITYWGRVSLKRGESAEGDQE